LSGDGAHRNGSSLVEGCRLAHFPRSAPRSLVAHQVVRVRAPERGRANSRRSLGTKLSRYCYTGDPINTRVRAALRTVRGRSSWRSMEGMEGQHRLIAGVVSSCGDAPAEPPERALTPRQPQQIPPQCRAVLLELQGPAPITVVPCWNNAGRPGERQSIAHEFYPDSPVVLPPARSATSSYRDIEASHSETPSARPVRLAGGKPCKGRLRPWPPK
jgi:hypothetical protein